MSGTSPAGIARLAARIFAVAPWGTGICLRARAGPTRDEWLALLRALLADRPLRKMPLGISDDRLLGGLDLSATLAAGRPIAERGLLADAHGGALIIPSAERLSPGQAARIASVHDGGEVRLERDGLAQRLPAQFGLVLLDEAASDDEHVPASLTDRAAMQIDLSVIRPGAFGVTADDIADARERARHVDADFETIEALCQAAAALGIASIRAPMLALKVAKIAAALDGRDALGEADLAIAGQLVLGWRATMLPQSEQEQAEEPQQPDAPDNPPESNSEEPRDFEALSNMVLEAIRAALPPDLLAKLAAGRAAMRAKSFGQAGVKQRSLSRGRRAGIMQGDPRRGARLDLVATLRAAAPWQKIRAAEGRAALHIRAADFRVVRFARKTETVTIFAVDASGSLALNRMAEAKGAVESLLAECYVRRDHVAMLVFGGKTADLVLPPTRALVRAKRRLTGLPAGGGTPLASGLDAATALAQSARARGQTPLIVLLTDGRANIARDGRPGRQGAHDDALASARLLNATGIRSLLIDTAPRPDPRAAELAERMGAVYLALPYVSSAALSSVVKEVRAR